MVTLASPLPLPRSLQEMILAKLPLEDLLRLRAVCKLWRRISSSKGFRQRYRSIGAKPWFLLALFREVCVVGTEGGKLRSFIKDPWIPTTPDSRIASSSAGLLLLEQRQGHFTVVNPLTKESKRLPDLDVSFCEIAYSGIQCFQQSYKVVVVGLVKVDDITGTLSKLSVVPAPGFSGPLPKELHDYMQPCTRVYCSDSNSWNSITSFPPGFILPYRVRMKSHQYAIANSVLYCTTNVRDLLPGRIARFDIDKMEWNPTLVELPEDLTLMSYMLDETGEATILAADSEMKLLKLAIEKDKVVTKRIFLLPKEVLNNEFLVAFAEAWGLGSDLFLHVPVAKNGQSLVHLGKPIEDEPTVKSWFVNLEILACSPYWPELFQLPHFQLLLSKPSSSLRGARQDADRTIFFSFRSISFPFETKNEPFFLFSTLKQNEL